MLPRYFKKALDEAGFSPSDKETVEEIGKYCRRQFSSERMSKEIIDGCKEILNDQKLAHPYQLEPIELFHINITEGTEKDRVNGKIKFRRVNYLSKYGVDFNFLVKVFLHYHHRETYGFALSKFFTMYKELRAQGLPYDSPEEFWEVFKTMKYYDVGDRDLDSIIEGYLVIRDKDMGIDKKSPEYLKLCSACSLNNFQTPLFSLCWVKEPYEDGRITVDCKYLKSGGTHYLVKENGKTVFDAEYRYFSLCKCPSGDNEWIIRVYRGGQWIPYLYDVYEKKYHKKIFIGTFGDY